MEIIRTLIKPVLTEKSNYLQNLEPKQYAFVVDVRANKHEIRDAFVALYGIVPTKIKTLIRKPARVRTGTLKPGFSKETKIAYITLPKGKAINTTNEAIEEAKEVSKQKSAQKAQLAEITKADKKTEKKPVAAAQTKNQPKQMVRKTAPGK
ncbi:MAG: 50S ribosomal protein L23 [Malacoplasma sp.]|nr:50S ribosomal protein L23 [Malacoplasma sp.]